MTPGAAFGLLLLALLGATLLCVKPLGSYIADVLEGRSNFAVRAGNRFEVLLYRCCGIDSGVEMSWRRYAIALLLFNLIGAVAVYALQRLQAWLPSIPQHLTGDLSRDRDRPRRSHSGGPTAGWRSAVRILARHRLSAARARHRSGANLTPAPFEAGLFEFAPFISV